jgi:hypothetical protein
MDLLEDFDAYDAFCDRWDFSTNFNPNQWKLDSQQIAHLDYRATHQTIVFRDPYSYANSLYNFWQAFQHSSDEFIDSFEYYFDYAAIVNRLPTGCRVILYDDIVNKPQQVIDSLTDYLEIPRLQVDLSRVNTTVYQHNLIFSDKHCTLLNTYIDKFQEYTNNNLDYWKKNV